MYQLIIVDDEVTIAEGVANLFPWREIGFAAKAFCDSTEAMKYIQNNHVDVVMSDIEMPQINGLELARQVSKKGTKVVIISSHQNYEYFRSAIQLNVADFLLKPIKSADIIACFERIKQELDERNHIEPEQNKSYYEKILDEVKKYIEDNFQEASLEAVAIRVNLSASYLSRILKEKCDFGFAEYLVKIRMEKAAEMLMDSHYKSYDIAYYVGYDNPKSFHMLLKGTMGGLRWTIEKERPENEKKILFEAVRSLFFRIFIPTFLLFVIAMVVFGRNAEQRLISQEQKVLESTDTNLSLVVNNIAMQNDLFTKNPYMGFALKNILKNRIIFPMGILFTCGVRKPCFEVYKKCMTMFPISIFISMDMTDIILLRTAFRQSTEMSTG